MAGGEVMEGSAWMERFAPSVLHKTSMVPRFAVDGGVVGGSFLVVVGSVCGRGVVGGVASVFLEVVLDFLCDLFAEIGKGKYGVLGFVSEGFESDFVLATDNELECEGGELWHFFVVDPKGCTFGGAGDLDGTAEDGRGWRIKEAEEVGSRRPSSSQDSKQTQDDHDFSAGGGLFGDGWGDRDGLCLHRFGGGACAVGEFLFQFKGGSFGFHVRWFRSRSDIEVSEKLGAEKGCCGFGGRAKVVVLSFKSGIGTCLKGATCRFKGATGWLKGATGRPRATALLLKGIGGRWR